jgi:hypothetical protein
MIPVLRGSLLLLILLTLLALPLHRALAGDSTKIDAATKQVETGAKQIGQGVEDTAKGVGNTVVEGAKITGEKIQEAGKEVKPQAETAWQKVKAGANSVASGVTGFFKQVFGD